MKKIEEDILKQIPGNFEDISEQDVIRINETYEDITPLFQHSGKDTWYGCAKVICYNSNEKLEKYIPSMLEWIEDMNWPGAETIFDKLKTFDYCVIKPYLDKAMFEASNKNNSIWLDMLKILNNELNHFELDKIIDERNAKIDFDDLKPCIKEMVDCAKKLNDCDNENDDLIISLLSAAFPFIDPIIIPYIEKYKNQQNDTIRSLTQKILDRIDKVTVDLPVFTEKSNNEFWKYLEKIDDYDLDRVKEDILNPDLRLCALRLLNLYSGVTYFVRDLVLPYIEPFINDIDDEIKSIANIVIRRAKIKL